MGSLGTSISQTRVYILMSLAMFSWAIAWTNAKIVNEYMTFYNLVFLRFFFGFISLLPLIISYKVTFPKAKNLIYVILPSTLFFIYNISFFKGTFYGLASEGAVLVTTLNPLVTIILVSLIGKSISRNDLLGLIFGVLGGFIIMDIYNNGFHVIFNPHNIYFLVCALSWGCMTVSISYGQKVINPYMFICLCYFFTMIISFPFTSINNIELYSLDTKFYINFFLVSVGSMSFGTSIYMYFTPVIGPTKVSVFIFSVPFIAIGLANLLLGEPITVNLFIGGLFSLLSIYIVNR